MKRVPSGRLRRLALAAAIAAAGFASACASEDASAVGCPLLCPGREVAALDTTLNAISFDTTLVGYPAPGFEGLLLLATAPGGTLDLRVLFRFDSVTTEYTPTAASTSVPITAPDSAALLLQVDTSRSRVDADFTVEAFDVDSAGVPDTAMAALAPLVRPGRLFASRTFVKDSLLGPELRVPIDPAMLVAAFDAQRRVRLALRVRSAGTASLFLSTSTLSYRPAPDSGLPTYRVAPSSKTPAAEPLVAAPLRSRSWSVVGTPPVPSGQFAVGGVPGARAYLSFAIPGRIVDSSSVLRATLTLTQVAYAGPRVRDTLTLYPFLVLAAQELDYRRAADLVSARPEAIGRTTRDPSFTDSLRLVPGAPGTRSLDITSALRRWRLSGPTGMRRDLVFVIGEESFEPGQLRFASNRASDPAVRPRLRLVYTAPLGSGLP